MAKKSKGPGQYAGTINNQRYYYNQSGRLINESGAEQGAGFEAAFSNVFEPYQAEQPKPEKAPKKARQPRQPKEKAPAPTAAAPVEPQSEKQAEGGSIGGFLGRKILQEIFPGYYEFKDYKKQQQKQEKEKDSQEKSDQKRNETEFKNNLGSTNTLVKESNFLLRQSLTGQDRIISLLEAILATMQNLTSSGIDLPNRRRRLPPGRRGGRRGVGRGRLMLGAGAAALSGAVLIDQASKALQPDTENEPKINTRVDDAGNPGGETVAVQQAKSQTPSGQREDLIIDAQNILFDSKDLEFMAENILIDAKNLSQPVQIPQVGELNKPTLGGGKGAFSSFSGTNSAESVRSDVSAASSFQPVSGSLMELKGTNNFNPSISTPSFGTPKQVGATSVAPGPGKGYEAAGLTRAQVVEMIKEEAARAGVDPNVAIAVANSEGLNVYSGDRDTSFGPFQLHYKDPSKGFKSPGLGDRFTKETGLHASDPNTVKQQIQWIFKNIGQFGWRPFHGARNTGIGDWQGIDKSKKYEEGPTNKLTPQMLSPEPMGGTPNQPTQSNPAQGAPYKGVTGSVDYATPPGPGYTPAQGPASKILEDAVKKIIDDRLRQLTPAVPTGGPLIPAPEAPTTPQRRSTLPSDSSRTARLQQGRSFELPIDPLSTRKVEPSNPSERHIVDISRIYKKYGMVENMPRESGFA